MIIIIVLIVCIFLTGCICVIICIKRRQNDGFAHLKAQLENDKIVMIKGTENNNNNKIAKEKTITNKEIYTNNNKNNNNNNNNN